MTPHSLKVLLIEDNPGDARLIMEMMRDAAPQGVQVERAADLTSGLQRLSEEPFQIVLLDLNLPESRGFATYERVRQCAPSTPVVVLTGRGDEELLAGELLSAGAQDYLVKGQVDPGLLVRSLRYAVERSHIEQQLRQRAEELAEAARRKDEFLAALAHELRNPLAPIAMALELLRHGGIDDDQREWSYRMMDRQIRHMSRLIDDLLDISRISRGKIALQKEIVDLTSVAQGAAEAVSTQLRQRQHEFTLHRPPGGERITLEADPVRLEQIIVNLLTNAAKFTEPGGRIDLVLARENGQAIIRVRDTGVGIPSDMLERIFEMFAQVDRSTSRASQWGLGIGLALVRGLVELHDGQVSAISEGSGRGSEFIVSLPLGTAANIPSESEGFQPEAARHRPARVLIVDDQVEFASSTANLLRAWGHHVQVASSGEQAIRTARQIQPELILLDIGMPGMDGYQVARHMRRLPEAMNAVMVAVTGYGRGEDIHRSGEAGFDQHVVKPLSPEVLRRIINGIDSPPMQRAAVSHAQRLIHPLPEHAP